MISRSENMRRIRSKNTKPEMLVRRLVHGLGYRYRLHVRDLPGCPDMVFRRRRAVLFVHGCFWHQHTACSSNRLPKSNQGYWQTKLARNIKRDAEHLDELERSGWRVLIIWECELSKTDTLVSRLRCFLDESPR